MSIPGVCSPLEEVQLQTGGVWPSRCLAVCRPGQGAGSEVPSTFMLPLPLSSCQERTLFPKALCMQGWGGPFAYCLLSPPAPSGCIGWGRLVEGRLLPPLPTPNPLQLLSSPEQTVVPEGRETVISS